ncbi:VPLPA-CTERM protein sorting domain-containing protein [Syntrophus gentianae]|uniref:VPLPA-CTERM protein sorting domain-containing protein n=1 Tax=Syntrophus gentianae TaxID=43775 RepID=A0A1H7Z646_9BACT|nr:VPLPA-CTERM sorting domain-containing protein [Syntrophus gentianae]SEM53673.1 VPLPA-CTERM protein sorting domain-containing protein [Syntrophus gentianae]
MRNKGLFVLFVIGSFLLFNTIVSAAPIFFNDRASFNVAAGGGLSFESFENDFAVAETIVFNGFTVSETSGINALGQLRDFPGLVNAITDGTGGLGYDDNDDSIGSFFAFTNAISAFGLDIATNPGSTITIGGSVNYVLPLGNNTPSFWGVIDTAGITSITFDASGGPNVGFDAVSFGQVVPIPAAVWLFGSGLVGLAGLRRKFQK